MRLQRHQLGDVGQKLNDLKLGLQQFAMDEERIIVRVSERHDIELRSVLNDYRETEAPSVDDIQSALRHSTVRSNRWVRSTSLRLRSMKRLNLVMSS